MSNIPTRRPKVVAWHSDGSRNHWGIAKRQMTLSLSGIAIHYIRELKTQNELHGLSEVIEILVRLAIREDWDLDAVRDQLLLENPTNTTEE